MASKFAGAAALFGHPALTIAGYYQWEMVGLINLRYWVRFPGSATKFMIKVISAERRQEQWRRFRICFGEGVPVQFIALDDLYEVLRNPPPALIGEVTMTYEY